ncbi:MAG: PfkB family carbohydrate kinase [Vulcanimicrobiota bacterium]
MIVQDRSKILPLEELAGYLQQRNDKKVVHCHGVYDLLHIGHIKHLEAAKKMGDILVVTITPDHFVNKGPGRPAFTELHRAEALAALDCVDLVAINKWPTAVETLRLLRPNLYVKGVEYSRSSNDITGKIDEEAQAVRDSGGEIAFTEGVVFSSSSLINAYVAPPPPKVKAYLQEFKQRYGFDDVARFVEGSGRLKVLVVGEAIIDEYQYCEALGKSSKEPTLVARRTHMDRFAGGALAVANHLANFVGEVSLVTLLGAQNPQLEFVEEHLNSAVHRHYVIRKDGPTIVKRRYVEADFFQKLFEMYDLNDVELDEEDNDILCRHLEREICKHDLVLVVDYGHGFLSRRSIDLLCSQSKFLAVNAQTNAGNQGYHTVSTYPRADLMAITEREMRLEARRRRGDLHGIVVDIAGRLNCPKLCITRGSQGCLTYEKDKGFLPIPAIAQKVVDRVGAGDAFLSVAALCAAQGAPLEICGLAGNAAGAQAVATVCNKDPVNRMALLRHLQALLK